MDERTPQEWTEEALSRMRMELDCCKDHLENEEFQQIVSHMTNLSYGCRVTAEMICEKLLSHGQIVELLQSQLEQAYDQPFEWVRSDNGYEGFRAVPIDVPDDASGLE